MQDVQSLLKTSSGALVTEAVCDLLHHSGGSYSSFFLVAVALHPSVHTRTLSDTISAAQRIFRILLPNFGKSSPESEVRSDFGKGVSDKGSRIWERTFRPIARGPVIPMAIDFLCHEGQVLAIASSALLKRRPPGAIHDLYHHRSRSSPHMAMRRCCRVQEGKRLTPPQIGHSSTA